MVLPERVMADGRGNEIAGDQVRALVDQLVKSMLPVRARLTPNDGTRGVGHRLPVAVHGFAVAFHVALLEIGCKAVHVLVIGKDGFGGGAPKLCVPDADQGHDHRDVLPVIRVPEMLVCLICAAEQPFKAVIADAERDGQPDGTPSH